MQLGFYLIKKLSDKIKENLMSVRKTVGEEESGKRAAKSFFNFLSNKGI